MKKAVIALAVVAVIVIVAVLNLRFRKASTVTVEVTEVVKRRVAKTITASGTIKPKRQVNVSASAIGKVTKVAVKEGDWVEKGDFLLQIDPTDYESQVARLRSALRSAEAKLAMEKANLEKAEEDYRRAEKLFQKGFLSEDQLRDAKINLDVQRAMVKTAREALIEGRANLEKALHDLDEVSIRAEMSGVIVALNVEEGENAIMGTLNNPGTVLLTIADLSEMEAEVEVDETEVVGIEPGQEAEVNLDAFPDTSFVGVVSEVGNSAIRKAAQLGQESVDFKVVVAIRDSIPGIRPGLSCSVKIKVAEVESTLSIPIQSLTVRKPHQLEGAKKEAQADTSSGKEQKEIEGVFVVEGGIAHFRPVVVGITGEEYFEVKSGLREGEKVVSGSFRAIKELKDGAAVKVKASSGKKK